MNPERGEGGAPRFSASGGRVTYKTDPSPKPRGKMARFMASGPVYKIVYGQNLGTRDMQQKSRVEFKKKLHRGGGEEELV